MPQENEGGRGVGKMCYLFLVCGFVSLITSLGKTN